MSNNHMDSILAQFNDGNKSSLLHENLDRALGYQISLVTGNGNVPLAEKIAAELGMQLAKAQVKTFSDGEIFVQVEETVRGKDVFVIQPTCPPVNDHLMELLIMIDTLKRSCAKRITAVIPYYGYGRQDRKVAPRVPISARLVADLIQTAGVHRVLSFELHAGQIQGFFNVPVDHMYANTVFQDYFNDLLPKLDGDVNVEPPCIVSPDAGGMERARAFAKRMGASLAFIDKRRPAPNVCHVMHVVGEVEGKICIIVDDMVDTAGTLTQAAIAIHERGAKLVYACCVHGLLSGPAIQRIQDSPIRELVITDSIPLPPEKQIEQIKVVSTARIFADTIKHIHREESVSKLFD